MSDEEIIALINEKLAEEFELDAESLDPSAQLVEGLGLDSLDLVDLVVLLQEGFKINLRDDPAIQQIRTLGDVYAVVIARAAEAGEAATS